MRTSTLRRKAFFAATLLLTACSNAPDPSGGTCERRDECGNLEGLTLAECTAAEQALLDRLDGDTRQTCADAIAACLDGETCDDFRACHAAIDRATCPCPDPGLTIVSPTDGQTVTSADDADPSDPQIQLDFVVDTVCLEDLEQVELFLLDPVESSYGFDTPDGAGRAIIRAPLLPGESRYVARGTTTPVESAIVTLTASP